MKNQIQKRKIFKVTYSTKEEAFSKWVDLLSHRITSEALAQKTNLNAKTAEKIKNGLSPKSRQVLTKILLEYDKLKIAIPDMADRLVLNTDNKKLIRDSCNMAPANFNGLIAMFREIGIIAKVDGVDQVCPSVVPPYDDDKFIVSFSFQHNDIN